MSYLKEYINFKELDLSGLYKLRVMVCINNIFSEYDKNRLIRYCDNKNIDLVI
jgi:hypothetical protein